MDESICFVLNVKRISNRGHRVDFRICRRINNSDWIVDKSFSLLIG